MPKVAYDRNEAYPALRSSNAGKNVQGPHPCDRICKGDLIRVRSNERKVRAVMRCGETGYIVNVWAAKLRCSGYPSPHTHIDRHSLKQSTIVRRGVDLYSTPLEAKLQMAIDRHVRELHEKEIGEREFDARDVITESDIVNTLI